MGLVFHQCIFPIIKAPNAMPKVTSFVKKNVTSKPSGFGIHLLEKCFSLSLWLLCDPSPSCDPDSIPPLFEV